SDSGSDSDSDSDGGGSGCTPAPSYQLKVLAIHSRSLGNVEDPDDGPRVRKKRLAQAESIANISQALQNADPGVRLVVLGDFNAFEFSDGLADVTGHMKGDFDPDSVVCQTNTCIDLVNPDLVDQVLGVPADDRYSFIFGGNAQVLDHILTSQGLAGEVNGVEFGRGNADAPNVLVGDPSAGALRSSDHDGMVLYLSTDCPRELKIGVVDSLSA
ncbi:MAG: hypothetical protein GY708_28615, partial [Actinomycetia bacterium]|nr:hypothetical protein [Actinomycetes bacterium]